MGDVLHAIDVFFEQLAAVEFSALIDESGSLRVYEHRHASRRVVHHYPVDVWQSFSDADGEHLNPRRGE